MQWIKAFHLIFMVTWFSGLFYLPRLYVYHAMAKDQLSKDRFIIMERKLYYGITTPGAILTIFFGTILLTYHFSAYIHTLWFKFKFLLVLGLVGYHIYLGRLLHDFKYDHNHHGHIFYRLLNEVPVLFLIIIVVLVVVKPA